MWRAVGELLLPRACAGCGRPGSVLCDACRWQLRRPPRLVGATRVDVGVPVYALGPYGGAHRGVILAAKERTNLAVRDYVGAVIGAAVAHLRAAGEISYDAVLVPAPTRPRSRRTRGGDPVAHYCRASGVRSVELVELANAMPDQATLGAADRVDNVAGHIRLRRLPPGVPLVLVDDVLTTGATLAATTTTLQRSGANVQAALVVARA
ncbi:hypothetical protein [Corynebacterium uterequi]|uniref:Putative amidophosphoribosyltransferase n=1 Tax=Corynebacterium uterequi TaxID=1072256 RepID=A0A0G3HEX9_9CORY|nr:hypothetical protein [Corynebacterium uterequi]AKK10528.1 putative amidophosphoribosyltransferase [Corynebacterium uterequi]